MKKNKWPFFGHKQKWFKPKKVHTGWRKVDKAVTRRRKALRAHKGDLLATARSLQSLANVTQDKVTKQLAGIDARFFFKKHKNRRGRGGKSKT